MTLLALTVQSPASLVTADVESSQADGRRVENVTVPSVQFNKPHMVVQPPQRASDTNRIVGGTEVNPLGPSVIAYDPLGCGGSLVAPNVMLTAAHCQGFISGVQFGRHDISSSSETFESFTVLQEVPHPNYDSRTSDYDFMMVRLNGSSAFAPLILDNGGGNLLADGTDLIVRGWGTTSSGGPSSNVLLEVEVDADTSCGSYSSSVLTPRMFCAGRAGKDSCQGDSGSPIIHKSTGKQVGIVSWGYGCADPRYPGVYAKVSDQFSWIQTYINAWSPSTPISSPTNTPIGTPVSSPTNTAISAPVSSPTNTAISTPVDSPTNTLISTPWNYSGPTNSNTDIPFSSPINSPTKSPTDVCDWSCYLGRYPDLLNEFGDNLALAEIHYINNGQGEGRNCACDINTRRVCDWRCYLDNYPDLRNSFEGNEQVAAHHYISKGRGEGRDCTCNCNWLCYLARYPDLEAISGGDQNEAAYHWRNAGQSEGRDCTCGMSVCYWRCYLDNYHDLRDAFGNNEQVAAQHYTSSGKGEGRDCTCNCNWTCYLDRYQDLKHAFGDDPTAAAQHWRITGQSEGRDCTCKT